ncbi:glycosyltransferase family 4 protein [Lautropia mirabilis]
MKKHIAYVCADAGIPVFGTKGASIHVQSVVRAALKAGHRVTLFATRFDGHVPPGLENVACVHLPEIPQGDPTKRAHAALEARDHIAERLDAHAPYDMVYERYSLWSDVGMRWARKHGIPGILEVNAPLIEEQRTHRQLVLEDEARAVAQSAFSQASAILAVSPGVADYLHTARHEGARACGGQWRGSILQRR